MSDSLGELRRELRDLAQHAGVLALPRGDARLAGVRARVRDLVVAVARPLAVGARVVLPPDSFLTNKSYRNATSIPLTYT